MTELVAQSPPVQPGITTLRASAFAACGALVAAVLDAAVNEPSLCSKLGTGIVKLTPVPTGSAVDTMGASFAIALAVLLAHTQAHRTSTAALTAGLMIFSTISALMPNGGTASSSRPQGALEQGLELSGIGPPLFALVQEFETNATLPQGKSSISSCKPFYRGFLGLGSAFRNTVGWCPTDHRLDPGERVQVLETWQTGLRGYTYARIRYRWNGTIQEGWVSAGTRQEPWTSVRPDSRAERAL